MKRNVICVYHSTHEESFVICPYCLAVNDDRQGNGEVVKCGCGRSYKVYSSTVYSTEGIDARCKSGECADDQELQEAQG